MPTAEMNIVPGSATTAEGVATGFAGIVAATGASGALFTATPPSGDRDCIAYHAPAPIATATASAAPAISGVRDRDAFAAIGDVEAIDRATDGAASGAAADGGRTVASGSVAAAASGARWAAARSASENSRAVWKRSSAFFASALRMTASIAGDTCRFRFDGGSGSSFRTFCMIVVDDPENGRSPVRNW